MDIVCLWAEMSTGRFARGVAMFMGRCGCGRNVHIHIRGSKFDWAKGTSDEMFIGRNFISEWSAR